MHQGKKTDKPLPPGFAAAFEGFCEELAEGGKHKELMKKWGLEWKYMDAAMRWRPELKARYDAARESRSALWAAQVEDELHRRALDGVEEQTVTPKGQIVTIVNTDSKAAIRLFDELHPKRMEAKVETNLNEVMLASLRAASGRPTEKKQDEEEEC